MCDASVRWPRRTLRPYENVRWANAAFGERTRERMLHSGGKCGSECCVQETNARVGQIMLKNILFPFIIIFPSDCRIIPFFLYSPFYICRPPKADYIYILRRDLFNSLACIP